MAYKQSVYFNQNTAGKVAGYCLQNVRRGYGIASKYPYAITAWEHTQQHKDHNIPGGVDVPVYYTYGSYGHINVKLKDGRCWSDGKLYASVNDYLSKHPSVHYLGWGESVNDVRVIEYVADAPTLPAVGSRIHLISPQTRTTWKVGTAQAAGHIRVTDNTFDYIIRGYDPKYPGRAIINSKSGGGDGVGLALYYLNGSIVDGWKQI
jgi:hypothetical protein